MDSYIIKLYDKKKFIYYIYRYDRVGNNINYAEKFYEYHNGDEIASMLIKMIFKKHGEYTISKHTYDHLKNDYFNNIKKKDLKYKIVDYPQEIRRLKLKKINKKINERQN